MNYPHQKEINKAIAKVFADQKNHKFGIRNEIDVTIEVLSKKFKISEDQLVGIRYDLFYTLLMCAKIDPSYSAPLVHNQDYGMPRLSRL